MFKISFQPSLLRNSKRVSGPYQSRYSRQPTGGIANRAAFVAARHGQVNTLRSDRLQRESCGDDPMDLMKTLDSVQD
jgi:hypothetical protein